jgi:glycosyltransferase involved in cell wall biosynthesis
MTDRRGFALVHTPFTNVKSYRFKAPQVVTFLDLQHEYFPEFFSQRELKRRRAKFKLAAILATHLIAISGYTKQCVIDHYGISAERIDVVPLASNPDYAPRTEQDKLAEVKAMHSLNKPFLYYPAATWPHKNHAVLLKALNILVERHSFNGELVLTGISSNHHDAVRLTISELGLESQVRILGYLPYEEMPHLFNLARLLVFPSLYEGFGIPLVEAMASGCPVVCANATSIPEVVGDAALMFDPGSPEVVAEAIWSVWNDEAKLSSMREKGLQRAKEFSWQRTVAKTMAVYRRVLGQTHPRNL